jgi:ribosome-associated protein
MHESDNTSRPSRSQRKREVLALQDIGEKLVDLPATQLAQIPLEPLLAEAVDAARTLKSREGLRRQLQYIGRLIRNVDIQPILEALDKISHKDQQAKAQFHQIERWREKLIKEGDKALEELVQKNPELDRQHLRQLIRKAQQDRAAQKKSGAETEMFRYLRELLKAT